MRFVTRRLLGRPTVALTISAALLRLHFGYATLPSPPPVTPPPSEVTELLAAIRAGHPGARDALFHVVYDELKRLAAHQLRHERHEQTLGATALVHEAWLRLSQQHSLGSEGRGHFFGIASQAMRRILVDQARRRQSLKRSRDMAVTLEDGVLDQHSAADDDVLAVHEALERLAALSPRQAQLVEYRYFAGFTTEEAAGLLDISVATANRDWALARAWLQRELTPEG
jgi:RNA polymerase sigma factor (TIGR02999 family)